MYSALVERIRKQLLSDDIRGTLLSLPENLVSLRRLCHMPDTDIYDIELAVAKEPSFAAYILKLANSVLYGSGKPPCQNIVSVIRRLGIHNVSQYALTFALKKCHDHTDVPQDISVLLRENWQLAWGEAQEATQLYSKHRLAGDKAAKTIDLSDVLMLGILLHTGKLAVYSDFFVQYQDGKVCDKQAISDAANQLNMKLLPLIFNHLGLPSDYFQVFTVIPEINQPLQAADYLFAVALLKAYPKKQLSGQLTRYNFLLETFNSAEITKLAERLSYLGILTMDELDLAPITAS
jgi:hypothetical protein